MPNTDLLSAERRRHELLQKASEAADRILMDGCDGSRDELEYLTIATAKIWAEKATCMALGRLLMKEVMQEVQPQPGPDYDPKRIMG